MFVSHKLAEVTDAVPVLAADYQGWHFVEKQRVEPWFHLTMVRPLQNRAESEVVLIDSVATLKIFMESFSSAYQMASIQVVTSGWLNGSQDWKMEPLAELWESQDGTAVRYTTRELKHYYFPSIFACASDAFVKKLL